MARTWSPDSWHGLVAEQQPAWPDAGDLDRALKQISSLPPLVFAGEARSLQSALGQVAAGNAFLLQAGDCAESFEEFWPTTSAKSCASSCRWPWYSPTHSAFPW